MSHPSSPPQDGSQANFRRLKLVMSTGEHQHQHKPTTTSHSSDQIVKEEVSRSGSPARPSYSPVTPTLSQSSAPGHDTEETEWIDEPEPLPVSLDENPDAIALQATLSLLQMQRQQSLKDIRGLNKMRQEALENPEAFVEDLKSGKLSKPAPSGISVDPDIDESDEESAEDTAGQSRFGKLPVSQNIARCPPIEWSKYHISGEPLNRLHELQQQYPGVTEGVLAQRLQLQPHEIAAPYRPFTDKLNPVPPSTEKRNYDR